MVEKIRICHLEPGLVKPYREQLINKHFTWLSAVGNQEAESILAWKSKAQAFFMLTDHSGSVFEIWA
jgi:hypothetical protein